MAKSPSGASARSAVLRWHQASVMLVRQNNEDLKQRLIHLEKAIDLARREEAFIDEINNGTDDRI